MTLCEFTSTDKDEHKIWINPLKVVQVTPIKSGGAYVWLAVADGDGVKTESVRETPEAVAKAVAETMRWLLGSN
jgi:hypothetical protein